jgi:hypothetical protein
MYIKNYLLALVFSLSFTQFCLGQIFTKIIPQDPVGVCYSHNAWVDFDNDGDLDFLVTGQDADNEFQTLLYENLGNDRFRQALAPFNNLPKYADTQIDFLNINYDDRIDLLLMGSRRGDADMSRISMLENHADGFIDLGSLPDFGSADGYGTISVGDVNSDGTSDIFISGITGYTMGDPSVAAYIYLNQNGKYIKSSSTSFKGLYLADSKLVDLDNDQDLDLIVSGSDIDFPYQNTEIYFNDGLGNFQLAESELFKLQNTSIDVADYDGDNDLDILLTGFDIHLTNQAKLYRNDNGIFTDIPLNPDMSRTASGAAKWGDYDNDGDLDILITGQNGDNPLKLAVFQNNGQGQFEELIDTSFETLGIGFASWGDYDYDGDLDILVTGAESAEPIVVPTLYILKNEGTTKNRAPSKPANFKVTMKEPNSSDLSWSESTDDFTPSSSLTYNLSIRNASSDQYLLHPFSDNISGKRRVMEQGNVWLNNTWNIKGLEDGMYSAKVQAIDGGILASEWSDEKIIYAGLPASPGNVKLSYRRGKRSISWQDNSNNEEFFIIERRSDSSKFVKIDSVISNTTNYYIDTTVEEGLHEYRVYAVNPNQRSGYSETAQLVVPASGVNQYEELYLYPNPATDLITIISEKDDVKSVHVDIVSISGVTLQTETLEFNSDGEVRLYINSIPPGFYFVRIKTNNEDLKVLRLLKR